MISPTTQDLEKVLRAHVAAGSGLDVDTHVIPGNDPHPAPKGLYATVLLIDATIQGVAYDVLSARSDNDLDVLTVRTMRGRYSVQWCRKGARDAARQFAVWTSSPLSLERARRNNVTLVRVSTVRQIDTIVSDKWEERAGVDLDVGYLESVTQEVASIASAQINVSYDGNPVVEVGTSA